MGLDGIRQESFVPNAGRDKRFLNRRRTIVTTLLEKVFKKAGRLPEVEQNALAKWGLDELHSETQRKGSRG
jgi:hypothetical protein